MARARSRTRKVLSGLVLCAFGGQAVVMGFESFVARALGGAIPLGVPWIPGLDAEKIGSAFSAEEDQR